MAQYIEDFVPVVKYAGLNTTKAVDFSGASSVALPAGTTVGTGGTLTAPVIAGGLTASGSAANDFSASTGTFKTSTGAVTIGGGAVGITGATTFTTAPVTPGATAPASSDLVLNTVTDTKTVKLNSRDYTQVSGDSIGFVSKPNQSVGSSGTVYGAQISPRVATGISLSGSGSLVGLVAAPILKGNTAASIAGDVRAISAELDDEGSNWTISGKAVGLRIFQQLTATVTGGVYAIKVDASGNTTPWTSLIDVPTGLTSGSNGGGADVYLIISINGTLAKITAKYVA